MTTEWDKDEDYGRYAATTGHYSNTAAIPDEIVNLAAKAIWADVMVVDWALADAIERANCASTAATVLAAVLPLMRKQILLELADSLDKVPPRFKVKGNADSYSHYYEGWDDCMNHIAEWLRGPNA